MNADSHPCQCGFCVPQLVMTAVDAEVEIVAPEKPVRAAKQPDFERQTRIVIQNSSARSLVLN
jgi:xanthine dehydrogenase iron-sulfur cluster and FAD-binding subunit A